jgi:hypothetical protein
VKAFVYYSEGLWHVRWPGSIVGYRHAKLQTAVRSAVETTPKLMYAAKRKIENPRIEREK